MQVHGKRVLLSKATFRTKSDVSYEVAPTNLVLAARLCRLQKVRCLRSDPFLFAALNRPVRGG